MQTKGQLMKSLHTAFSFAPPSILSLTICSHMISYFFFNYIHLILIHCLSTCLTDFELPIAPQRKYNFATLKPLSLSYLSPYYKPLSHILLHFFSDFAFWEKEKTDPGSAYYALSGIGFFPYLNLCLLFSSAFDPIFLFYFAFDYCRQKFLLL